MFPKAEANRRFVNFIGNLFFIEERMGREEGAEPRGKRGGVLYFFIFYFYDNYICHLSCYEVIEGVKYWVIKCFKLIAKES